MVGENRTYFYCSLPHHACFYLPGFSSYCEIPVHKYDSTAYVSYTISWTDGIHVIYSCKKWQRNSSVNDYFWTLLHDPERWTAKKPVECFFKPLRTGLGCQ